MLDGGLAKWRAEGRAIEAGERRHPPATFTPAPRQEAWADKAQVLAAIGDGAVLTLNALSANAHGGASGAIHGRAGHIAGSQNVPYASLLGPDGAFLGDEALHARFEAVGAFATPRVICYRGGGISATMTALALTHLGHPDVAVYDGSLAEWSRDPEAPMAMGA